jgi:glutamate synthase domain-containing protein 2
MKALKSLGRFGLFATVVVLFGAFAMLTALWSWWMVLPSTIFGILALMGVYDLIQTKHSILRNYPVLGHMRFFFEGIRPEIRQYLIESDQDEEPFSRDDRSLVYQRAKGVEDARPFGTRMRVYDAGYSWVTHSVQPSISPTRIFA